MIGLTAKEKLKYQYRVDKNFQGYSGLFEDWLVERLEKMQRKATAMAGDLGGAYGVISDLQDIKPELEPEEGEEKEVVCISREHVIICYQNVTVGKTYTAKWCMLGWSIVINTGEAVIFFDLDQFKEVEK